MNVATIHFVSPDIFLSPRLNISTGYLSAKKYLDDIFIKKVVKDNHLTASRSSIHEDHHSYESANLAGSQADKTL